MKPRQETAWSSTPDLYSDYYERRASYSNWRPRGSGDYLLICTESGAGRFVTASGVFVSQKGDVVLFSPEEMQDYGTDRRRGLWHLSWAHFVPKPEWQIWLDWPANGVGLKVLRLGNDEIYRRFRRALSEVRNLSRRPFPEAIDLASNSLEAALLWARATASIKPGAGLMPG